MSDFEDRVRRTFAAHGPEAPSADGLLEAVEGAARGRAAGRWLVPLAASALTAALLVAVVTDGFGLLGDETASQPVPVATTSTPNPRQSAIAAKCDEPPVLHAPGSPQMTFNESNPQKVSISVGQRIFMASVVDSCGGFVTFDGRPRTDLLTGEPNLEKGAGFVKAVRPGTVRITPFEPMCSPDTTGCFGGIDDLGLITLTIVPKEPLPPVEGRCTQDQVSVRADAEPVTAGEGLWLTVRLRGTAGCRLVGPADIEIRHGSDNTVLMPNNPASRPIDVPLRDGKPVIIGWQWRYPFCDRGDPFTARLSILRANDTTDVNQPKCPTAYGGKRQDPAGIRFTDVMILR